MKRQFITLGIVLGAIVMFILGLLPAERLLTSDHSAPSESYILIGTGRLAAHITALCEFIVGCLVAALWMKRQKKMEPNNRVERTLSPHRQK
jgi:hypothetical protein